MSHNYDKMKVLAVDDNRTNLHILQVFLKKLGHDVILAENGEEAVRRFIEDKPDLVLLDIMMPIMDGFEAARQIKASGSERWTPIIFLSALNRDENLVEGLEAGADDYLTKPINFVVLEAKLRSMQRSLRLQQAAIDGAQRVQAISDNVLEAIVTADEDSKILTVNRAAERIFGQTAAELIGQPIASLMSEQDALLHSQLSSAAPERELGTIARQREGMAMHKDGHHFPVEVSATVSSVEGKRMFIALIRDISERKQAEARLFENARLLQAFFDRTQAEQHLALRLMEKQLHRKELQHPRLRYKVTATEHFSGDVVAAACSPEGRFYAMLADATGHGLSAAISVLPLLALFYRMTRLNRTVREITLEINHQLKESMPVGRFVAASIVCLDEVALTGEIWIGGTPDALLLDRWGRIERRFPSENLPLGVVDRDDFSNDTQTFTWSKESQLVLFSDGLIEAANGHGEQFGSEGVISAAANTSPDKRFAAIEQALAAHLGTETASDDVSLMLIDCP